MSKNVFFLIKTLRPWRSLRLGEKKKKITITRKKEKYQTKSSWCSFGSWLIFSLFLSINISAQPHHIAGGRNDSQAAQQYVQWIEQAMNEGRLNEAYTALERVMDFSNVSSDISYLAAVVRTSFLYESETRHTVLETLNTAIDTNRWVNYNNNLALLLKAEHLVAMREYTAALACIEQIAVSPHSLAADAAMLRLLAFRGLAANGDVSALVQFRSLVLNAFDRFPRDPRPLRIFFGFANNRYPQFSNQLSAGDIELMELALRRLPFLLEIDPELAWMAAPFIRNLDDARRLVASYRAGGISNIQNRDFFPHPASIPVAIYLGLMTDNGAADELFAGNRGINNPFPAGIKNTVFVSSGSPVLFKNIIEDVFNLLRSEDGREYFTLKLLEFTGAVITDNDYDGYIESFTLYQDGIIRKYAFDRNQDTLFDLTVIFDTNGIPVSALSPVAGQESFANVYWERFPSVQRITFNNEEFTFSPADFHFAPLTFMELGGARNKTGILYPVILDRSFALSYRSLISSCSTFTRPGVEFDGAIETFYMERGFPVQAVQVLNGNKVSITEFERGEPVIQHIDLDLDGRMETVRRFRSLSADELSRGWQFFNYRSLLASSESDWSGDGRHKTKEVYLGDGSVVYYYDMDGSGEFNYSRTGN
ncbi:MAG: hypothetical protein LBC80_07850 [Treponema sp.]|nr:hypothetical protein [Treponema sp.]